MNDNMKWCVCKFYYSAKNTITECDSKEEAIRFANNGKKEAMEDESVVRYFVALLNKTEDGYERDSKHPNALNFYEMIDVLKEK